VDPVPDPLLLRKSGSPVECLTVSNFHVSCEDALPLPKCEIKTNTFEKGFKLLFSYRFKMIYILNLWAIIENWIV